MRRKTTKKQVMAWFRELWLEAIKGDPSLRFDAVAKREAFNNYVDSLNKDRIVTDDQAYSWGNPF